jgi:hypothetical protein
MQHVEIRVKGQIDEQWSDWFSGLTIRHTDGDATILTGSVADQAALYGLIARLRDLGLPLVSVETNPQSAAVSNQEGRSVMSFDFSSIKWSWVVIGAIVAAVAGAVLELIIQFGYGVVLGFQLRGSPPPEMLNAAFTSVPFFVVAVITAAVGALIGVRMAARRSEGSAQLAGLIGGILTGVLFVAQRALRGYPWLSIWTVLIVVAAALGGWLAGLLAARRAEAEY